ncbi:DegT/DnrJ/EryC1/StrS family aminotransferase [Achromobacter sp. MY14]|uniref:DegT/DnrJ/EryC1/StrS family aminotransferase n=1 Tax=unclassified Achromobacter TaxID=2626865 RepID=UPI001E31BCBC|nr:DegT/DnrJ/EryC1/StrS family aminotransferase [Achromobacter sp. MY14]MCD0495529.1 DegT/DnrJ/EryC1/StrS family aminotransferase [Achromobacter sp. MY14]
MTTQSASGPDRLWPWYSDDINDELTKVLRQGDLGAVDMHPAISKLERAFEALVSEEGSRSFAAFYSSGTSALLAALGALDLPSNSEVIVPDVTFRGTATPCCVMGLSVRFAKTDELGGLCPQAVAEALSDDTRAVIVNHQWGVPADIDTLCDLARTRGLMVIEDCSHAHGGVYRGRKVGAFGDIAVFSCGTTKLVSGGLGGVLVTRDRLLYERAIIFGQAKHRVAEEISDPRLDAIGRLGVGLNLRGSPISATLAFDHLSKLGQIIEDKNANLEQLTEIVAHRFPALAPLPRREGWETGTWYKRPFRYSGPLRTAELVKIAVSCGLRVEEIPHDLPDQFEAAERASALVTPNCVTAFRHSVKSRSNLRDYILFDTRDCYGESFPLQALDAKLSRLAIEHAQRL